MTLFFFHVLTNNQVRKVLCVKMRPLDNDATMSADYSDEFTKTSNIFEHSGNNHLTRKDHSSSG